MAMPFFARAETATGTKLIPCGGPGEDMCTFEHVLQLIENVINFSLNYLFFPLFVIAVVYAGYLLMTSGDNTDKRKQAKDIFVNILIGLFFVLASWLIIKLILVGLGYDSSIFSTFY
ncbi:hypothetical protein IT403_01245 [Candidatus Nomurabacteria bacterium]|nr:hypothetical protein [Candidatus Nomurabacteria bacterium]